MINDEKMENLSHLPNVSLDNNNISKEDAGGVIPETMLIDGKQFGDDGSESQSKTGISFTNISRLKTCEISGTAHTRSGPPYIPRTQVCDQHNNHIFESFPEGTVISDVHLTDKKSHVQDLFKDMNSLSICNRNHKPSTSRDGHETVPHKLAVKHSTAKPAMHDMILSPKKLLDKLLVVCPNVDYCEEVLSRCDLEAHISTRCKGAITKCLKADRGCVFQGPRSALQSHMWECPYREVNSGGTLSRVPVVDGDVSTIDIQRGCYDLGLSFVGGIDTPLLCVVIQEIFAESVVSKDNRLQPGDQILEVNGVDLTTATHAEAKSALSHVYPICRLTVFREKSDEHQSPERQEVIRVSLPKLKGKQLGIKLVGKKNGPGLYILDIVSGGTAFIDGRLKKDDRILEINCQNMDNGTQEQAAQVIQASMDKVQFVISRTSRPQTPDIIRSASRECLYTLSNRDIVMGYASLKRCKERSLNIHKDCNESLGISVAGGYGSPRGDIPIYVTNMQTDGCIGRSKHVKKGDILLTINGQSLLDLTHTEAVTVLKSVAEARGISLKFLEGTETCVGLGNFTPSWKYWLSLPSPCYYIRTVVLDRPAVGTLGFSIVGGNDSGQGPVPIYIKSIVPNTIAGKDGRLRSGDLLQSVNGHNLEDVAHCHAVSFLKGAKGFVSLRVVSWPGTAV